MFNFKAPDSHPRPIPMRLRIR